MPGPMRHMVAEGFAGIIRSVPDEAKIILQIEDLPRERFDALRGNEEATYLERSGIWMALVPFGAGCFLEVETTEAPALKAVSWELTAERRE